MAKRQKRKVYLCEQLEPRRLLAVTLTSNTTVTGVIDVAGKQNTYEFAAAAGDRIILSAGEGALATPTFDPEIQLIGTTGTVLQTNSTATSAYIEIAAPTTGTYNVIINELNNNTTGDYRLTFDKVPNNGPATDPADGEGKVLSPNSTTTAAIATVGDIDLYTFTAAVGDRIILSMGEGAAATATFDPYLALYGPTGAQLLTNSTANEAFIEVTAATAGTYSILARELNNNTTGDYSLYLEQFPFAGNATDPADGDGKSLVSNTTTSAAIGSIGDLDLYTFTAAVGDQIVLSAGEGANATATFDPFMALYSPAGVQLGTSSTTVASYLEITATTAGTYGVLVRELNNNTTSDYKLYFDKVPFAGNATDPADGDGKTLVSNTTTEAVIADVGDLDLYTFTGAVGDRVFISMGQGPAATATFEPDITLYSPTGASLFSHSGASAAFIETTLTVAGTYSILARELNDTTTGDYHLFFIKLPFAGSATDPADGDGAALVTNTTTSASIGVPGDLDLYTFNLAVGESALVSVGDTSGNAFTPYLAVYRPDGTMITTDIGAAAASIDVLNATVAGTYYAVVADNAVTNTGNYALHFIKAPGAQGIDPVDQDGGTLTSGQGTSASITIADVDAYTFTLAAGGNATIRVSEIGSTAFTPEIDVFGPSGTRLNTNAGAASALVTLTNVTAAGTYTVVVRDSGDDSIGQYAIALDATPAADTRLPNVITSHFDYTNIDRQQLVVLLSENIGGTLETSDLVLQNLTTNTTVPVANVSATFNSLTNEIVFRFPGYASGILPDGNYRATLGAGSLTDTSGNLLAASTPFDFFAFGGDANHDRSVGFADLVALAQNYGKTNSTFSKGDFNYDGNVDFADLVVLAQKYGTSLPPPAAAPPVFVAAVPLAPVAASKPKAQLAQLLFSDTPIAKPIAAKPASVMRPKRR